MRVWTRVLPLAKQRLNRLSYPRLRTYRNYITPDVCNWDWFRLKFENVYSDTFENMSYRTYLRYKATLRTPIALKIQTPIGFNSAKYDLNLIKSKLAKHLGLHEEEYCFTIMKNNTYACISTDHLKFLNVSHFLALGTSYAKFLKALSGRRIKRTMVRRRVEEEFKPEVRDKNIKMYQWMNYLNKYEGRDIKHARNDGIEFQIEPYPVDGYDRQTQI